MFVFSLISVISCKKDDSASNMPSNDMIEPSIEEVDTSVDEDDSATTDLLDTSDTNGQPLEECVLEVTIQNQITQSGNVVVFDSVPAQTNPITMEIQLYNPCEYTEIRFLGIPTEWIDSAEFAMDMLPPILLGSQESAQMSILFTPADEGEYSGNFSLPYNHPAAPFNLSLSANVSDPLRIVLVGDGFSTVTNDYGITWTDTIFSTEIHSNDLRRGACWGLGHFFATGGSDQAKIWSSTDGSNWTEYNPHTGWLADCAYGNEMVFVAGGFHWIHQTSNNQTWNEGGDFGDHLRTVTFGNGVFIAAGDEQIAISNDGTSWVDIEDHGIDGVNDITFGSNRFVAVGDNGSILTSNDDGNNWTLTTVAAGNIEAITHDGETFYIGDGTTIYQSNDGIGWTLTNGAANVVPRAFIGNTMYGTSSNGFFRSTDNGFSWEQLHSWSTISGFNDIAVEGY